ncbi:hypothetical protein H0H93_012524 [Arthromyces matolae]|nr:hypothetical protein H0H93_012524 [Arthromyces matolae]
MANSGPQFSELRDLSHLLANKPECFALGSEEIRTAALDAAKFLFDLAVSSEKSSKPHVDDLLSSLEPSSAPQTRSQTNGKRKRSSSPALQKPLLDATPINSLFIEGMNNEQVWTQLDLRAKHICDTLEHVLEGGHEGSTEDQSDQGGELHDDFDDDEDIDEMLRSFANPEADSEGSSSDEASAERSEGGGESEEDPIEVSDHEDDTQEGITNLRDPSSDESDIEASHRRRPRRQRSQKQSQLDDGFFDLDSFNAETEEAEAKSTSRGRLGGEEDSEDEEMIDLFTGVDEESDLEEGNAPGEAMYADFFAPPRRTGFPGQKSSTLFKDTGKVRFHEEVRVKSIKPSGKNLPLSTMYIDDDDDEQDKDEVGFENAGGEDEDEVALDFEEGEEEEDENENVDDSTRERIERLKNDLFADEDDDTESQNLSTHEKRVAELQQQISELESENVGPKDWVLMGEAGSRSRPQNSLLEEDLEFERAMKAVPVVTEQTVHDLEERIKARISENRFDDVVRIRPLDNKPFLPSRFLELKDTKSTQSLAQIYEDEFIASKTGGVAGDDRDGKLKNEHDEIEKVWEGICLKLDALCNSYFLPKQPKAAISTISNVSTATLESALPTTKSATTMLAPEEVFAPSTAAPRARSELTPAEKRALRGRERKARKKSRDALDKSVDKFAKANSIGSVKRQKKAALESVVKSGKGVTVVGKPKDSKKKNRDH